MQSFKIFFATSFFATLPLIASLPNDKDFKTQIVQKSVEQKLNEVCETFDRSFKDLQEKYKNFSSTEVVLNESQLLLLKKLAEQLVPEDMELPLQCIRRNLKNELPNFDVNLIRYYGGSAVFIFVGSLFAILFSSTNAKAIMYFGIGILTLGCVGILMTGVFCHYERAKKDQRIQNFLAEQNSKGEPFLQSHISGILKALQEYFAIDNRNGKFLLERITEYVPDFDIARFGNLVRKCQEKMDERLQLKEDLIAKLN